VSTDSIALVTGAARGQGAAIVRRPHKDGFRVAACDLLVDDVTAVAEALGDAVIALPLDVTDAAQWATVVASTVERFGALTTLVNKAGVLHRASLADETPAGFEGSWRVNCLGPFLGIRAALPHLREAEAAAIVNTCSTGAIRPFPNHVAYGSAKWALRGLTQAAAAELAASSIRVNAVFPGPVATPMLDEATQARLAAHSALGRIGTPTEIADAVAFLVPAGILHHRFGARRRRRPMPANRMTGKGFSVGIIGGGPGGLALGIFLSKAGFRDFTIFDREDGVGGTWRINTYPGLACDVKSHLYSYSFDLNANWSRLWWVSRRSWITSSSAQNAMSSAAT
jgi:3alpha(or 20beta)-hydroxysteroid dehydrogenase